MKITLEFDTEKEAYEFTGWWLDGGGEQDAGFNTYAFDLHTGYLKLRKSAEEDEM